MDPKFLKDMLHAGVDLIIRRMEEPPVTPVKQSRIRTYTMVEGGDSIDLTPPEDDGKGPWKLLEWRPDIGIGGEPMTILAHWTRVVSEPVPGHIVGDFRVNGSDDGEGKPPWEGSTTDPGAAADGAKPPSPAQS